MNYIQNNWLLDEVMPNTTGNEFKIIAAVARQSLGWGYGGVILSLSDFQELTGMSRPSVTSNIEKAVESGYLTREAIGKEFGYRVVASKETLLVKFSDQLRNFTTTGKVSLPVVVKKLYQTSKETLPTTSSPQEEESKESKESTPQAQLIDLFTELTSIAPMYARDYDRKWFDPVDAIYKASGNNLEEAKRCMADGYEAIKGSYTISTPFSVMKAAIKQMNKSPEVNVDKVWRHYLLPAIKNGEVIKQWPDEYKELLRKIGGQRALAMKSEKQLKQSLQAVMA